MDDQNFKITIHTLARYTTFGHGSYAMSTLKRMTGTKSFKQLPDHQKKCLVHNREDCQSQKYLEQLQKKCKCIPWALKTDQDSLSCGLEMEVCVANQTMTDKNCWISC